MGSLSASGKNWTRRSWVRILWVYLRSCFFCACVWVWACACVCACVCNIASLHKHIQVFFLSDLLTWYHCLCGDSPVGVMASRKSPSVMSAVRCLCVDSGLVRLLLHKHLSRCVSLRTEWCPFSVPDNLVVYVSSANFLK